MNINACTCITNIQHSTIEKNISFLPVLSLYNQTKCITYRYNLIWKTWAVTYTTTKNHCYWNIFKYVKFHGIYTSKYHIK